MSTSIRRLTAIVTASVAILALAACGTPPWADPSLAPKASNHATTSPHKATPTATATPVTNDLAGGSATHTLGSGAISLQVKYWSDLPMNQWTAGASKPLNISATATLNGDQGQAVYLSQVTATPVVTDGAKVLKAPAAFIDTASVSPGYLVKTPYSYTQTFTIPALDSRATAITLNFNYALLLQSTPTSGAYAKQSASDQITIAITK